MTNISLLKKEADYNKDKINEEAKKMTSTMVRKVEELRAINDKMMKVILGLLVYAGVITFVCVYLMHIIKKKYRNMEEKDDLWMKRYFECLKEMSALRSEKAKALVELNTTKSELGCREREIERLKEKLKMYEYSIIIITLLFMGMFAVI